LNRKIPRLAVSPARAYRLFYPQVPVILSAKYRSLAAAMPANSCMSVSDEPAMIGVSVRRESKTNAVLKKAKNFSINWLNLSDKKIVSQLSSTNKSQNKLKALNIPYSLVFAAPVLKVSAAYIICQKESVFEVGDHDLFVGRLLGAMASLDFDESWKFEDYKPVLYLGSNFRNPFSTLDRSQPAREK